MLPRSGSVTSTGGITLAVFEIVPVASEATVPRTV